MTRIAVLADIHGNLPALEAVVPEIERERLDAVIVAGDVINWGPFSREVLERVTTLGWVCIRGNNEYYLLDFGTDRAPAAWSGPDFPILPWLAEQLDGVWRTRIACWPDTISLCFPDAPPVRVVHGSPRSAWQGIFPDTPVEDINRIVNGTSETTVITAHTHLAMDQRVGLRRVLNPGSVGVPLLGTHEASWLLLESHDGMWHTEHRSIPFDVESVLRELERQGFIDRYGAVGQLIYREFAEARVLLDPFVQWRNQHHPGRPLSHALLEQFSDIDLRTFTPPIYRLGNDTDY